MVKLVLVTRDRSQAWYRTRDGKFDVLGDDLDTNTAAGRAAGAGAVWSWRPAHSTRDWTDDMHSFGSKQRCLDDLARHIGAGTPPVPPAANVGTHGTLRCPLCHSTHYGLELAPSGHVFPCACGARLRKP